MAQRDYRTYVVRPREIVSGDIIVYARTSGVGGARVVRAPRCDGVVSPGSRVLALANVAADCPRRTLTRSRHLVQADVWTAAGHRAAAPAVAHRPTRWRRPRRRAWCGVRRLRRRRQRVCHRAARRAEKYVVVSTAVCRRGCAVATPLTLRSSCVAVQPLPWTPPTRRSC
jgi:hypothetical protein